jgi:hypothetical protein
MTKLHCEIAEPSCRLHQPKTSQQQIDDVPEAVMKIVDQVDPCRTETYNPAGSAADLQLYDTDENYWNRFIPP